MKMIEELKNILEEVEIGTNHNGYSYRVRDILIIMICGLLCSLKDINDISEWSLAEPTKLMLEKQFGITNIPCRAQFYNIIGAVDSKVFNDAFGKWMKGLLYGNITGMTVAIDGKTIRSTNTHKKNNDSPLHIASAYISELKLVIGNHECETKTNEIIAFRELIKVIDISECIVVADALHCHKKSADTVIEANADYIFVVKDNQPNLKEEIEVYMQTEIAEKTQDVIKEYSTLEQNGGRIEKRTAYICHNIEWMEDKEEWNNLSMIGAIHREVEKNGTKSSEWHYYISSIQLSAEELLYHARAEWGIESMHWLLDVHYSEDKTKVWDMNLQKTLNILRKVALNIVNEYKATQECKFSVSKILKRNLFDMNNFGMFLDVLQENNKLD